MLALYVTCVLRQSCGWADAILPVIKRQSGLGMAIPFVQYVLDSCKKAKGESPQARNHNLFYSIRFVVSTPPVASRSQIAFYSLSWKNPRVWETILPTCSLDPMLIEPTTNLPLRIVTAGVVTWNDR